MIKCNSVTCINNKSYGTDKIKGEYKLDNSSKVEFKWTLICSNFIPENKKK